MRYLGESAGLPTYVDFIKQNLTVLFEVLVIPNISLTQQDIDEYEDEPLTYLKNDLEESDAETRRRQCMKFVQALSKRYPAEINELISGFINHFVTEYEKDKQGQWQKKVALLNLIITASISCYTYQHGATDLTIDEQMLANYL